MENIDLERWYRPKIDKTEFRKLCEKSDWQGFKHMIIFFLSLLISGYLAFFTWGSWWCILFFIIYGNIYCSVDAIWHETGHKTAFKSKFWNEFFYQIASYMNNFEPVRWRWSHFKHHTFTAFTKDPFDFEIAITKPTDVIYFFSLFIPFTNIFYLHKSLQFETLKHALGITTDVMKVCIPEKERDKCRNSARIHVGLWIVTAVVSLNFNSWLPLIYIVLPVFYGNTHRVMCGLTQHTGLHDDIKDHRYSTRTVILNPISSFLYWQMEYHIEHHVFPIVPSYNLPKLHELIKDQLPPPKKGFIDEYKEIIPAILKQAKNPEYKIDVKLTNR